MVALAASDCERLRAGWLAQPANAVSSVAFLAMGIWLLGVWRRGDGHRRGPLVAGGLAMIGAGLGSFAYHGPQPSWAGPAHDGAVVVLAVIVAAETIRLLARTSTRAVVAAAWRAALPWLGVAGLAYVAGSSRSTLCRPSSLWQPHGVWHLAAAVGLGILLRLCSSSPVRRPVGVVSEGAIRP